MDNTKKKILIVDDSELNRALLSDMLADEFGILEAETGLEALEILREHELEIVLVLLDIVMPVMDGFEVLAKMNETGWIKSIPVIMISAEVGGSYIDRAYDLGAIDYISRPFDERTVKHRVTSNFLLSIKQRELADMLSAQIYEHEKDNQLMIKILSHIVEFRNGESGSHVIHVHAITEKLLRTLGKHTDKYPLTSKEIQLISNASSLHDIGKIAIPEEILNKPGKFTPEEFAIMKSHTLEGAKMLDNIPFRENEALVKYSYEICRWHHERYDGRGYPDGLVGDDIPISAQVVAMADVYDALTSVRCYKPAFSPDQAVSMILNGECGTFNPVLLDCLRDIAPQLKAELHNTIENTTEQSIQASVQQILKSNGQEVSARSVRLLERERMKFQFLSDISREITFEYVAMPEMVKLSSWSAESLGMPEKISNPLEDELWCRMFPKKDFTRFIAHLRTTSPENPVLVEKYLLEINGEKKWNKVYAKVMWEDEERLGFEGAIIKIVDINNETIALQDMENKANRDARTGLWNHNAARRMIHERLLEGKGKKFALAVFDIDDFKQANDQYGHLFGDEVLEAVAERIRKNIRSSDIGARMGGDEFILFMEYTQKPPRGQLDRIFKGLTEDYKGFKVGVSMGVACTENFTGDYDELFRMADTALYSVKRSTKCRYAFYDESMKSVLSEEKEESDGDNKGKKE